MDTIVITKEIEELAMVQDTTEIDNAYASAFVYNLFCQKSLRIADELLTRIIARVVIEFGVRIQANLLVNSYHHSSLALADPASAG